MGKNSVSLSMNSKKNKRKECFQKFNNFSARFFFIVLLFLKWRREVKSRDTLTYEPKMLMKTNKENVFMFRNYKSQVSVKLNYISTKQQLVFLRTHETEIKPKSFSNYVHGFTFIKCNLKHMVSDGRKRWKDSWIKSTHGKQKPKSKTSIKTKKPMKKSTELYYQSTF